jgi:hypothetical protein
MEKDYLIAIRGIDDDFYYLYDMALQAVRVLILAGKGTESVQLVNTFIKKVMPEMYEYLKIEDGGMVIGELAYKYFTGEIPNNDQCIMYISTNYYLKGYVIGAGTSLEYKEYGIYDMMVEYYKPK